jgi:hypothetical protein
MALTVSSVPISRVLRRLTCISGRGSAPAETVFTRVSIAVPTDSPIPDARVVVVNNLVVPIPEPLPDATFDRNCWVVPALVIVPAFWACGVWTVCPLLTKTVVPD